MQRIQRLRILHLSGPAGLELELGIAERFRDRLAGLTGLTAVEAGRGIILPGCGCIHTAGMRCAIDVAFVVWQRDAHVAELRRVFSDLRPWRVAACSGRGLAAIEVGAGTFSAHASEVGSTLEVSVA